MPTFKKNGKNYLEWIPVKNPEFKWTEDAKGIVTVDMVHKGIFDKIAQKIFFTPEVSHIKLDQYGSFVWKQIDGSRDLIGIGQMVGDKFGENAEPLYERLSRYFETLKNNKFVIMKKK